MSDIKVGKGFISLGNCNGHTIVLNVEDIREVHVEEVETSPAEFNPKTGKVIKAAVKEKKTLVRFNGSERVWQFNPNSHPPEKIFDAITQANLSPTEQLDARLQEKDL